MQLQVPKLGLTIFLSALVVRFIYLAQYLSSPLPTYLGVDHNYYLNWANRIADGAWLGTDIFEQAPLYAYFLGTIFFLVSEQIVPVLVFQLLLGATTCVLVYACGRRLFGVPIAALAGIVAAVYGPFVFYECAPMKSFLSPWLSLVVLYGGLRYGESGSLGWLSVTGSAVGLACLIRENHILLVIPLIFWVWTCRRQSPLPKKILHLGVSILCVTLILLPTLLRNWYVGEEFVVVTSGGGEVFYMAHGPNADGYYATPPFVLSRPGIEHEDFRREAQRRAGRSLTRAEASYYWFREGLRHIGQDPQRTLRLTVRKAWILLHDFEVPDNADYRTARRFIPILEWLPTFGWIVGFGLLGIVFCSREIQKFQLPLGIVAVHVVSILILFNFGRFRLGMMPVWILFSAVGMLWLINTFWRWWIYGNWCQLGRVIVTFGVVVGISVVLIQPRHPVHFDIYTALTTGILASRQGNYALAERQLRRAWTLRQQEIDRDGMTATRIYNLARTHQELAIVFLRTEHYLQAIHHFRLARQLPQRIEAQKEFLDREIFILKSLPIATTVSYPELQTELETALIAFHALSDEFIEEAKAVQ